MLHLSRRTFLGMHDDGVWKMPTTMHITYCGKQVTSDQISNKADCDECLDSQIWENIDQEETHEEETVPVQALPQDHGTA
jgi:hypothetical protein